MPLHFEPEFCEVDESRPHTLLIRFNRPKALNSMPTAMHAELSRVMKYYDGNDDLWVAVVTGNGRAFCAGYDLKEAAGLVMLEPDLSDLDPNGEPDCQGVVGGTGFAGCPGSPGAFKRP
jgi:enoyl-CoA hydratase/carnithine racemase